MEKEKMSESSEITEKMSKEALTESDEAKEAEATQEETLTIFDEGSELIEENVEIQEAEPVVEVEEELSPETTATEEKNAEFEDVEVSAHQYADQPFLADRQVKSEFTPKWNWGAMAMPIFFGVANRSYLGLLSLLALIPWIGWIFGIVWAIVFGINGERWALQNPDNNYRDEEEFRKVMDGWNRAGLVAFIISIVISVLVFLFLLVLGAAMFNTIEQFQY